MVKSDPAKFWVRAHNIKQQLNSGINYFKTGEEYRIPYLPSKILYLFSIITNLKFYDENLDLIIDSNSQTIDEIKIGKNKVNFLIFQTILYYLSIIFLYTKIKKKINYKKCLFIILFLSLEPTILFYHSSFWSESIFFSILIFCISLIYDEKISFSKNFILGLLLGLLFLQRSVALYYIFFVSIYYIFLYKKKSVKPILITFIGYMIIVSFLGFHNFKRSGTFYIEPTQAKDGFYNYLVKNVLSKSQNIETKAVQIILDKESKVWIKKNKINMNLESDRIKHYNYLKKKSYQIILNNPFISATYILKGTLHFMVLDPLRHVHYFYKFTLREQNSFYKSDLSEKWIPIRVVYSFLIYSIIFLALYDSSKHRFGNKFDIFLLISIFYFTVISSWTGNTRYNAPNLIFFSFLFGNGIAILPFYLSKIKKKLLFLNKLR